MDEAKPAGLSSPLTFDTTSPEYVADPYPILRRIQEAEPLHKTIMGWLVTRYEDAANFLRESRIWGSGMTPERRLAVFGAGPMFEYASRRMNGYNPPEHTLLRSLVTKGFTAKRVEALRPRIQKIADDLLNAAKGIREFDVLETLAHPLPCQVICDMIGVPLSDSPQLSHWTGAIHSVLAPFSQPERMPAANEAASEFMSYIRTLLIKRRHPEKICSQG
jgi:cytochrome P450